MGTCKFQIVYRFGNVSGERHRPPHTPAAMVDATSGTEDSTTARKAGFAVLAKRSEDRRLQAAIR